jgi:pimeloyl-ACP methyl ester carboxylesterase
MNTTSSSTMTQSGLVKRRSRLRIWVRCVLVGSVVIIAVLGVLGAIYEVLAARADQRAYPAPGEFVDLGGRRIHMLVTGHDNGEPTPTVILESGIASFSSNWAWVQDTLAASTRVVSYDRAGLGWSDPASEPQDAEDSAKDLHAALQAADIQGPFVVVGHSYGGLVVRAFTDLYPDEVVGMVLVDASHPDQWAAAPVPGGSRAAAVGNRIIGYMARLGVVRLFGMDKTYAAGLPDPQAAEMAANLARPRGWLTSADVLAIWDARTRPQINQARDLDGLPLVVLNAPERPSAASVGGYASLLNSQQAELASLSSNSLRLAVAEATHESLVNEREHALVVVDAILKVIEAAETGNLLAAK